MQSLVSIIIPAYNTEKYIERCLDSVINQTWKNLQIICVDDGSTDRTEEKLKKLSGIDSRINVISKENGGQSSARNAGIRNATGKYLFFLDSDDWIDSDFIEKLVTGHEENDAEITIGGIDVVFPSGEYRSRYAQESARAMDGNLAMTEMFKCRLYSGHLCGKLFNASLFENYICDETIFNAEDLKASFDIFLRAERFYYLGINGYHYYQHKGSTVYESTSEKTLSALDVYEYIAKKTADKCFAWKDDFLKKAVEEFVRNLSMAYLDNYKELRYVLHRYQKCFWELLKECDGEKYNNFSIFDSDDSLIVHERIEKKKERLLAELDGIEKDIHIFVYGSGLYGLRFARFLKQNNVQFEGFVISGIVEKDIKPDGIHYEYNIDALLSDTSTRKVFVPALNRKNNIEVIRLLKKRAQKWISLEDYTDILGFTNNGI